MSNYISFLRSLSLEYSQLTSHTFLDTVLANEGFAVYAKSYIDGAT